MIKILDVELKTPTVTQFFIASAIVCILMIGIYLLNIMFGFKSGMEPFIIGIICGAIPGMYGVNIAGQGWRHKVVFILFAVLILLAYSMVGIVITWLHALS